MEFDEKQIDIEEAVNSSKKRNKSFYQYLVSIMNSKGFESDSAFYNHISMSRQTFAKIRKTNYVSRNHALLMSVGLERTYLEALDFMENAGYAFRKTDTINDWKIVISILPEREDFTMSKGEIYIPCPKFGGEQSSWGDKARRDYAHSFDSMIIKFLDNPAINSVFKHLVEMMADSTWGPVVASGVEINDHNYPDLNKLVNECVDTLNIYRPYVVISSALPGLNAMAFGSDDEPYVALSPLMVKTMSPTQLKFVIGHECGHIAMGHMVYHTVISIASVFASAIPILGPIVNTVGTLPLMAWSRRSEISADRAGLLCCGELEAAQRTLIQLEMPFMDASQIDISEYVADSERFLKKGILRKINEFDDAHPIIPKRIKALNVFTNSEKYHRVTSQRVSDDLLSDHDLEQKIESIVKVL